MNVLVLGATGFVGRALVPSLLAGGERVRAASRRAAAGGPDASVERVQCDVRAPETLPGAFRGVDCAYYLVHSMGQDGDYRAQDRRSAAMVARAAHEAGCRRLVYLGGVEPAGAPSEHLASRLEVGAILRAGPVSAIELRAAMIVGNGSASWQIVRDLALRLPMMVLPRWLESKSCPIAVEDVVTALLDARFALEGESHWFDIPGPEVLTARQMLMIVGELRGRRIPAVNVPLLTPSLSAHWLRLVSGAEYHVARELVLGLKSDLLPRDRRYWELTGHAPRLSFRSSALRALETERPRPGVGAWLGRYEEALIERIARGRPRRPPPEPPPSRGSYPL